MAALNALHALIKLLRAAVMAFVLRDGKGNWRKTAAVALFVTLLLLFSTYFTEHVPGAVSTGLADMLNDIADAVIGGQ